MITAGIALKTVAPGGTYVLNGVFEIIKRGLNLERTDSPCLYQRSIRRRVPIRNLELYARFLMIASSAFPYGKDPIITQNTYAPRSQLFERYLTEK